MTREFPMFYKHNFKHLFHQCHPLGKKLRFDEKIANLTFASHFHVKSSYSGLRLEKIVLDSILWSTLRCVFVCAN